MCYVIIYKKFSKFTNFLYSKYNLFMSRRTPYVPSRPMISTISRSSVWGVFTHKPESVISDFILMTHNLWIIILGSFGSNRFKPDFRLSTILHLLMSNLLSCFCHQLVSSFVTFFVTIFLNIYWLSLLLHQTNYQQDLFHFLEFNFWTLGGAEWRIHNNYVIIT